MKQVFAAILILVLLIGAAAVIGARNGWLTPAEHSLRELYTLPESRFVELDGQRIHLVDEGSGTAIILIHGSFGSLRNWADWSDVLRSNYRVVRFDLPGMGLSGPSPTGSYGVETNMRLLQAFTQELGLERFFLVATSSSGELAAAYAANYPTSIEGLILSNFAAGPMPMDRSHLSPVLKLLLWMDPLLQGWHPQVFWREILRRNFAQPQRVTKAMVTEWTDLNNRAQRMPPRIREAANAVPFARTPDDLARITTPTLLLWSADDAELPVETVGRTALQLLATADKQIRVVADCGHMLPLECGAQSAELALEFFADPDRLQRPGDIDAGRYNNEVRE